nr:uncharacterized protein LOC112000793 [Quercus suber]
MEKLAFTLVTVVRKLKPHFQAHTLVILTDKPLRKAMSSPEAVGLMALWTIELSEFDIQYRPHTTIKGQVVTNFIAEFNLVEGQGVEEIPQWSIHTDGSSNRQAGGAAFYLKDRMLPNDKEAVRKLKVQAASFILVKDILYKRGFSQLYLRCLVPGETYYIMREVHKGIYGNHSRSWSLVYKLIQTGYYWPTMQKDVHVYVKVCDKCQRFGNLIRTMARTPTGETPFRLAYGSDAVIPTEVGLTSYKVGNHNKSRNDEAMRL